MKGGVVDDQGRPLASVSLPTEAYKGQEHGLARMVETIRAAVTAAKLSMNAINAVGVATPGTMDIAAGMILDPPNLKPWQNVPVRQYVQDTLKLPTAFQNDANAAAFGEYWAGAGRGAHSMVLFTLGTGVGGGIVIGDMVVEGEHSHGAEIGHVRIALTDARQCGCGRWGCLEAYASATSVVKRTMEALAEKPGVSSLAQLPSTRIRYHIAGHLRRRVGRRRVGRQDRGGHRLLPGRGRDQHDAHHRPQRRGLHRRHDRGRRIVPGADTLARQATGVSGAGGQDEDPDTRKLGTDAGFIGAAACGRKLWKGQNMVG